MSPEEPYGPPNPYGSNPYEQPGHEQQPQQPQGQQPAAYGQQPTHGYAPSAHPGATTSMVLGLVALVGSAFTCGLTLLAGPFAWWQGTKVLREIDAAPGRYAGRDQARVGQVLGIVSTVLLVLAVVAVVALAVFFAIGLSQSESGTTFTLA